MDENIFKSLEINMVLTAIILVVLVIMFILGKFKFRELIIYFLIVFAIETEYRNYIHTPEKSVINKMLKSSHSLESNASKNK